MKAGYYSILFFLTSVIPFVGAAQTDAHFDENLWADCIKQDKIKEVMITEQGGDSTTYVIKFDNNGRQPDASKEEDLYQNQQFDDEGKLVHANMGYNPIPNMDSCTWDWEVILIYNEKGDLIKRRKNDLSNSANHQVTLYSYDDMGRMKSIVTQPFHGNMLLDAKREEVSFDYGDDGRLRKIYGGDSTEIWIVTYYYKGSKPVKYTKSWQSGGVMQDKKLYRLSYKYY